MSAETGPRCRRRAGRVGEQAAEGVPQEVHGIVEVRQRVAHQPDELRRSLPVGSRAGAEKVLLHRLIVPACQKTVQNLSMG